MTDIIKQAEDALVGVTLKKFSPTSDSQMSARLAEAGLYDDDLCYRAEEVDEKFADLIAHARAQEAEIARLQREVADLRDFCKGMATNIGNMLKKPSTGGHP